MQMASSKNESILPRYNFNYHSFQEECWKDFSAVPRPRWTTTEFGGHLREMNRVFLIIHYLDSCDNICSLYAMFRCKKFEYKFEFQLNLLFGNYIDLYV